MEGEQMETRSMKEIAMVQRMSPIEEIEDAILRLKTGSAVEEKKIQRLEALNERLRDQLAIADQMIAELQQGKFDSMPTVSRMIHEEKYGPIISPRKGSVSNGRMKAKKVVSNDTV
jgi:hypothetical protein